MPGRYGVPAFAAGIIGLLVVTSSGSAAPVSFTGGTHAQDFNGLPQTGSHNTTSPDRGPVDLDDLNNWTGVAGSTSMTGWTGSNPSGSSAFVELKAQNGSLSGSAGRGVLSLGTTGASDRALGGLSTSNDIPRFGVAFTNNSAETYTSVSLSFTEEQWRVGDPNVGDVYPFAYSLNASDIDDTANFTGLSTFDLITIVNGVANPGVNNTNLDGNLSANRLGISGVIPGLNWAPGQTLTLRWSAVDNTGQDNGLSLDDLSLTAAVPEPSVLGLVAATALLSIRRRASRVSL